MKLIKTLITILLLINFNYLTMAKGDNNFMEGLRFLEQNAKESNVVVTDSGLQYLILNQSNSSSKKPKVSDVVTVHYQGSLIDGSIFDSSYQRGEPISFALNQVIAGWSEGVQLMNIGDKFRFFIPSQLGYGSREIPGAIPANSVLIFDVELLAIK